MITQVFHCPARGSTWALSVLANASPLINDTSLNMQILLKSVLKFAAARLDYLKQGGKIPGSEECVW